RLARQETFLEPVDASSTRWRLPNLLRETLLHRAAESGTDVWASANFRAGEYYETEGNLHAAVRHYMGAHNSAAAAAALERATLLFLIITQGDLHGQALLDL